MFENVRNAFRRDVENQIPTDRSSLRICVRETTFGGA